jgi:Domain of unknown function (DU1801)
MYEQKTKPTKLSVKSFVEKVAEAQVREDCQTLIRLMKKITGSEPKMWGPAIIGFGHYHYKYASGHEGDICMVGFSPRKQNISLYVLAGFPGQEKLLEKIGKHKAGKGCLYIKKMEDIDPDILEKLIIGSIDFLKNKFGPKR